MKRLLSAAIIVLISSAAQLAAESIHETVPASATGTVRVSNLAGKVTVVGWSSPEVEISGTLGRGTEGLQVSRDGDVVEVKVKIPNNARNVDDSFLELKVPAQSSLDVEAVSASISVSGVVGALDLGSVSGDITARGRSAGFSASTVSGDIDADLVVDGEVETVSGDIEISSAEGRLEAACVSGDIKIRGGLLDRLEASSTSGDLRISVRPGSSARFELDSMSGDIDLVLPADVSAEFDLATFSGSIESDLGPAPRRTSEHGPGERLSFTSGSGDAHIEVESFSGTVTISTR